jgi:hypothetical protein
MVEPMLKNAKRKAMGHPEPFTETTTSIASGICQPALVRQYARQEKVSYLLASNGQLLFQPSARKLVKELKTKGLARRGRRSAV